MGLFMFAWLTGEGIIVWRWVKNGAPPTPGSLLLPSGVYLALAMLAEYQPARTTATLMAYGVVLAAYLEAPIVTTGKTSTAAAATPKATTSKTAVAGG